MCNVSFSPNTGKGYGDLKFDTDLALAQLNGNLREPIMDYVNTQG